MVNIRPGWMELEKIVGMNEAASLSGVSEDTLKRHHSDKIIRLSPRRLGMRVRDALRLKDAAAPKRT